MFRGAVLGPSDAAPSKRVDQMVNFAVTGMSMSRIPTKRVRVGRRPASSVRRKQFLLPRRSSYLTPSAETLASLNEDSSRLPVYHTAEELIRALEDESSD